MMSQKLLKELSKQVSYYLRHAPWEGELELDSSGWCATDQLLDALSDKFGEVSVLNIKDCMLITDKQCFEFSSDEKQVRAVYGHSIPVTMDKDPSIPPPILYHGTTLDVYSQIIEGGTLRPMKRQFVHLSSDPSLAKKTGARKKGKHLLINVDTSSALQSDVLFYNCGNSIWLSSPIPAMFLGKGASY